MSDKNSKQDNSWIRELGTKELKGLYDSLLSGLAIVAGDRKSVRQINAMLIVALNELEERGETV